jgi:hypothetical protein
VMGSTTSMWTIPGGGPPPPTFNGIIKLSGPDAHLFAVSGSGLGFNVLVGANALNVSSLTAYKFSVLALPTPP